MDERSAFSYGGRQRQEKIYVTLRYEDKLNFVWLPPIPKTCLLEEKKMLKNNGPC